jgi:hypothetical protein
MSQKNRKPSNLLTLPSKTGTITPIPGTTYLSSSATTSGTAYAQEASFTTSGQILTGITGNTSTAIFTNITGSSTGCPQWVSIYYQNTDDMGFGDQPGGSPDRIGGSWRLRRIAGVIVNGGKDGQGMQTVYMRDTHKGVTLSASVLVRLEEGSGNTVEIRGVWNGFDYGAADVEKIVVFPAEPAEGEEEG